MIGYWSSHCWSPVSTAVTHGKRWKEREFSASLSRSCRESSNLRNVGAQCRPGAAALLAWTGALRGWNDAELPPGDKTWHLELFVPCNPSHLQVPEQRLQELLWLRGIFSAFRDSSKVWLAQANTVRYPYRLSLNWLQVFFLSKWGLV